MPPAIIGAAIGVAGSIGGSLLAGGASEKAAKSAAKTQAAATEAELALGRESIALNKEIYGQNFNLLNPFIQRGDNAGQAMNALLGIPGSTTSVPTQVSPGLTNTGNSAPGFPGANAGSMQDTWNNAFLKFTKDRGIDNPLTPQQGSPGLAPTGQDVIPPQVPGTPSPQPAITPQSQLGAFNTFANSAGMQFQQQEAQKALQNGAAGGGWLQSGAAMKAATDRAQSIALNNYFMPYMGLLGGQQAVGAQAGSSVAGVGSNFGDTVARINGNMAGNIQAGANNIGNSQLAAGNAQANMWSNIGSSFGQIGGMISGYRPGG